MCYSQFECQYVSVQECWEKEICCNTPWRCTRWTQLRNSRQHELQSANVHDRWQVNDVLRPLSSKTKFAEVFERNARWNRHVQSQLHKHQVDVSYLARYDSSMSDGWNTTSGHVPANAITCCPVPLDISSTCLALESLSNTPHECSGENRTKVNVEPNIQSQEIVRWQIVFDNLADVRRVALCCSRMQQLLLFRGFRGHVFPWSPSHSRSPFTFQRETVNWEMQLFSIGRFLTCLSCISIAIAVAAMVSANV